MEQESDRQWEEVESQFPAGRLVRGVVTAHAPFGVFLDLGPPDVYGLITITDFVDEGRVAPGTYPPVGAEVEAVVLGVARLNRYEVRLSLRPGRLREAG